MNNKILKIFSGVVILVVAGKCLGFIRESFIAIRYGAGVVSDFYVFQDGLINALYTIWAGVLGTTFIPVSLSLEKEKRNQFTSNYLNIFLFIIIIISILSMIFSEQILHILVPGFYDLYSKEIMLYFNNVTKINMLSLVLVFIENFFIVLLQSNKFYIFSSIQGIILNSALILYLIFFYKYEIWGIIIVKMIAHVINIIISIVYIKNKNLYKYSFFINFKENYISEIIKLSIPVFILNLVSQLNYIIDRSMASLLHTGNMTLLNYANTIAMLIYSVLGVSLNSMAYTEMSSNQNDFTKLIKSFYKYYTLLCNILVPVCFVVIITRKSIVSILYGHGKLDTKLINIISAILILYIPGNLAMSLRDLFNRLLYIQKETVIPSIISGIGFGLNIIMNIIFIKYFGIYGLAAATSLTSILSTIVTFFYVYKKTHIKIKFNFPWRKLVLSGIIIIVGESINLCINSKQIFVQLLKLLIITIVCFTIYNYNIFTCRVKKGET